LKTPSTFVVLAFAGIAHAQVTCQTSPTVVGSTTTCNGSLSQPQPTQFGLGGDLMRLQQSLAAQKAAQQQAEAGQTVAAAQAEQAHAQAELLRQQAELVRLQKEML
jgi:hypothetical protein